MNGKFYHRGTHRIRAQAVVNMLGMKEVIPPVCEDLRLRSNPSGVEPARKIRLGQTSCEPDTISADIGRIRTDRPMVDNQRTIRPRHALSRFSLRFNPCITSRGWQRPNNDIRHNLRTPHRTKSYDGANLSQHGSRMRITGWWSHLRPNTRTFVAVSVRDLKASHPRPDLSGGGALRRCRIISVRGIRVDSRQG